MWCLHTCYLVASDAESALHKSLTYRDFRVLATLALIWGAVDIVGVSAEALWDYVWLSIRRSALIVVAAPVGATAFYSPATLTFY